MGFVSHVADAVGSEVNHIGDALAPIALPLAAAAAIYFTGGAAGLWEGVGEAAIGEGAAADAAMAETAGAGVGGGALATNAAYDAAMAETAGAGAVGTAEGLAGDALGAGGEGGLGVFSPDAAGPAQVFDPGAPIEGVPSAPDITGVGPTTVPGQPWTMDQITKGLSTANSLVKANHGGSTGGGAGGAGGTNGGSFGGLFDMDSTMPQLLGSLGSIYAGSQLGDAIKTASGQLQAGGDKAIGTIQEKLDPYNNAGRTALDRYQKGVASGGEFDTKFTMADAQNSEAMKFAQAQGIDTIQNSAAAKGGLLGSNTLAGLTKFGQANAAQYEDQAYQQWLSNRNANQRGVETLMSQGYGAAGAEASSISGIQQEIAKAQASGIVQAAKAQQDAMGNAIAAYGALKPSSVANTKPDTKPDTKPNAGGTSGTGGTGGGVSGTNPNDMGPQQDPNDMGPQQDPNDMGPQQDPNDMGPKQDPNDMGPQFTMED